MHSLSWDSKTTTHTHKKRTDAGSVACGRIYKRKSRHETRRYYSSGMQNMMGTLQYKVRSCVTRNKKTNAFSHDTTTPLMYHATNAKCRRKLGAVIGRIFQTSWAVRIYEQSDNRSSQASKLATCHEKSRVVCDAAKYVWLSGGAHLVFFRGQKLFAVEMVHAAQDADHQQAADAENEEDEQRGCGDHQL